MLYFRSRVINYGERYRFLHGFQDAGVRSFLGEQTDYLAIIYNKVDVQTLKLVNNDTRHGENGA